MSGGMRKYIRDKEDYLPGTMSGGMRKDIRDKEDYLPGTMSEE